eukprot:533844_1
MHRFGSIVPCFSPYYSLLLSPLYSVQHDVSNAPKLQLRGVVVIWFPTFRVFAKCIQMLGKCVAEEEHIGLKRFQYSVSNKRPEKKIFTIYFEWWSTIIAN